ncbi:uncharacterized protein LOC143216812 [Lasioglossum baleicum]|uniref:uncharacterized protein LOC143216812 n=1 Tax=Lasioglossum baleicum TaxID=434251 RepID=UPI003FCDBBCB
MPSNSVCQDSATTMNTLVSKTAHLSITNGSSTPAHCPTCTKTLPLNRIQISVYHTLHELIDKGVPCVILIDAPSGTGKTRILSTLAQNYSGVVQLAVFRRDQASQLALSQVSAYTYISYNMRNFRLNYREALCMFTVKNLSNTDVLFKLINYAHKYVHVAQSIKVIILDACTIVNPLMLLLLYIVSLKNQITLIFSGNKMQLGSINKSPQLHSRSNFVVLELFSDLTITELTGNLRCDDQSFLKKVARFGDAIAGYKTKKQIPFHFNLRYLLYTLFRGKFDPRIPESFDALFMAPFHHVITQRLYRLMKTVDPNRFRVEPFSMVPFNFVEKNKFFPGLILVKDFKYIYINQRGVNKVVVLEDMIFDVPSGVLMELLVRFEDGSRMRIARCVLNFYQLLPAYRNWLKEQMKVPRHAEPEIINFPLKPYTMTYHAALGRTISDPVELSTNCVDATSVYVGLCSLPSESNILKFHAEKDFPSFVVTDIMATVDNQAYYYRYPVTGDYPNILEHVGNKNGDEYLKSFLMGVSWTTVDKINDFENYKLDGFFRIKRSVYEKNKKEVDTITDSPLMEITKFVKGNTDAVVDVIKRMKLEKVNMNDTKRKEFRELKVYKALAEAYEKWKVQQREADKK